MATLTIRAVEDHIRAKRLQQHINPPEHHMAFSLRVAATALQVSIHSSTVEISTANISKASFSTDNNHIMASLSNILAMAAGHRASSQRLTTTMASHRMVPILHLHLAVLSTEGMELMINSRAMGTKVGMVASRILHRLEMRHKIKEHTRRITHPNKATGSTVVTTRVGMGSRRRRILVGGNACG